jgi:ubiquinone/menaquinone biosynthesis C-methylase UbiE
MNKKEIAAFFDRMAPEWDAEMIKSDEKINFILDAAGVKENSVVLDVACGTGVMFPYYLARGAERVIGVDISSEMARIAASKMHDPRVEVICGDVEEIAVERLCDCCVVYNAFPHFESPERLVRRLSRWLKPDGRLTVAHGMSIEALNRHHSGRASSVSRKMLTAEELGAVFAPYFEVDTAVSDDEKFVVAGTKR